MDFILAITDLGASKTGVGSFEELNLFEVSLQKKGFWCFLSLWILQVGV